MLNDLMLKYGSDKAPHGFCPFYEKWFGPVRQDVESVLEIGVADGASIRGFLDYFPNAQVYGLDAPYDAVGRYGNSEHWPLDSGRFLAFIGDQANRDDLGRLVEHGPWDIVIDDGGHTMEQQQVSLGVLFPHTRMFYVVEDLHTSFMDEITIYDPNGPKRSYPTGAWEEGKATTWQILDAMSHPTNGLFAVTTPELLMAREEMQDILHAQPQVHIYDRDGDRKHMTAVLVKEGAE